MIPFLIPKAKDQPDLQQKIHSSAELQRLLLPHLGELHQNRLRLILQTCYVKACTIFHWNLTLLI